MKHLIEDWFTPDVRVKTKSLRSTEFFCYSLAPLILFILLLIFLSRRVVDVVVVKQYNSTTCQMDNECLSLITSNIRCGVDKITYPDGSIYTNAIFGSGVYIIDNFQDSCITYKVFDTYSSCVCSTEDWGKQVSFTRNATHVFALNNPKFVDSISGSPELNGYPILSNSLTLGSLSIYIDLIKIYCYGSVSFYVKMEPSVIITPMTNASIGTYIFYKRECERSCTLDLGHTRIQLTNIGSLCLIQYTCDVIPYSYVKIVKQNVNFLTTITESFSITLTAIGVLSLIKMMRQPEVKLDEGAQSVQLSNPSTINLSDLVSK